MTKPRKPLRKEITCLRCGHKWKPYSDLPKQCSNCRTFLWNIAPSKPKKTLPKGICLMKNGKYKTSFKGKYVGCFVDLNSAIRARMAAFQKWKIQMGMK
jgi:hypothetical protein